MGTDMPTHTAEMPVLRSDSEPPTANQRAVCPHGNNYGSCLDFVCKGPASCYCCGYREGFRDGWDDALENEITREEAFAVEEGR